MYVYTALATRTSGDRTVNRDRVDLVIIAEDIDDFVAQANQILPKRDGEYTPKWKLTVTSITTAQDETAAAQEVAA